MRDVQDEEEEEEEVLSELDPDEGIVFEHLSSILRGLMRVNRGQR
jgi:hypothetical protein